MIKPPVLRREREGEWESCMKPPAAAGLAGNAYLVNLLKLLNTYD
ncbi:hypothetical protein [Achromobacter insuavis]|nr:hypothetical protein [Achromobacter insuavis]